jgi:hypothetical protein
VPLREESQKHIYRLLEFVRCEKRVKLQGAQDRGPAA